MQKSNQRFFSLDWYSGSAILFAALGILAVFIPWNKWNGTTGWWGTLETSDYGILGSFVAGISTPLFGIATVILLLRTYLMQKEELRSTEDALKRQRFEDNFFRLLDNHQRIVEAMELRGKTHLNVVASKRKCFRTFWKRLKSKVDEREAKKNRPITAKELYKLYDAVQEVYKADLHHYFRFIYHILKYVKNSEIAEDEKYRFTSILRATLSPHELVLIYYNCLHEFGDSHFKPLVEEFSFLKNNHDDLLFIKANKETDYHCVAFADSGSRPAKLKAWKEGLTCKQMEEKARKNTLQPEVPLEQIAP